MGGWELAGLERQPDGEQNITLTTFDGMVELVEDLVGVVWRLRGAAFYILNGSGSGLATGAVEGRWDGSADYVGGLELSQRMLPRGAPCDFPAVYGVAGFTGRRER